jgi:phage/plasmid-like protein (TIGR03299 family)
MFGFVDKMIGSGQAAWDTAGSLAGGRVVFMQVELEGRLFLKSNPKDQTIKRVLFFNSHDGSKALTGMITPVRVVCQNTLNAALGSHSNCFKIKHTKNYENKMDYAAKILGLASAYFDDLQTVMDTLDSKLVDKSYARGFVEALFPSADEKVAKRTESRRDEVFSLFSGGMGNNGRTGWDLYNAVTEYVDHHAAGRMTPTRVDKSEALANVEQEARFERAIFGSGATLKQKALDLLLN